jgi:hypothetical protein
MAHPLGNFFASSISRISGSDFPDETFHVLREKEKNQYSEYRTRRLVLEVHE